jgi:hypothetical protein
VEGGSTLNLRSSSQSHQDQGPSIYGSRLRSLSWSTSDGDENTSPINANERSVGSLARRPGGTLVTDFLKLVAVRPYLKTISNGNLNTVGNNSWIQCKTCVTSCRIYAVLPCMQLSGWVGTRLPVGSIKLPIRGTKKLASTLDRADESIWREENRERVRRTWTRCLITKQDAKME